MDGPGAAAGVARRGARLAARRRVLLRHRHAGGYRARGALLHALAYAGWFVFTQISEKLPLEKPSIQLQIIYFPFRINLIFFYTFIVSVLMSCNV